MVEYIVSEGKYLRGFFSNYLTVVNSIIMLQKNGVPSSNIKLGPKLFHLYGQASNWFDASICSQNGIEWDSLQGFGLGPWPTNDELQAYRDVLKALPWNERVNALISQAQQKIQGCVVGVHFRGTDHNDDAHGPRIDLDVYKKLILEQCSSLDTSKIFVCTDEKGIVENIQAWISTVMPQATLLYNDFCKMPMSQGLHWPNSPFNKIQIADEVIQDMICLSKCKVIIGKTSNVSTVARLYNKDVQMVYCDKS